MAPPTCELHPHGTPAHDADVGGSGDGLAEYLGLGPQLSHGDNLRPDVGTMLQCINQN